MKVFKVSCEHGEDKRASTKTETGDYFVPPEGSKKISKPDLTFQETPLGGIVMKFKTYGTAAHLPGHGRKPKFSSCDCKTPIG